MFVIVHVSASELVILIEWDLSAKQLFDKIDKIIVCFCIFLREIQHFGNYAY